MWNREEARSKADERALEARLRRTSELLQDVEERLADETRSFPRAEDYARDIHEIEMELAKLSQREAGIVQELAKASALMSELQGRRNEARRDELRSLEGLRSEAEHLADRVYRRPTVGLGFRRLSPARASQGTRSVEPPLYTTKPFEGRAPPGAGPTPPLRYTPQTPTLPRESVRARRFSAALARQQAHISPPPLGPPLAEQLLRLFVNPGPGELRCLEELLVTDRSVLERVDAQGNTPLHVACGVRPPSLAVVDMLVMAGAPLRATNDRGLTPFHVACLNTSDGASNELKRFLVSTVGYHVDELTSNGETAAHLLAVDDRHLPAMQFLIEAGCNLYERTNMGGCWYTPADVALRSGKGVASQMQELLRQCMLNGG